MQRRDQGCEYGGRREQRRNVLGDPSKQGRSNVAGGVERNRRATSIGMSILPVGTALPNQLKPKLD